MRIALRSLTWEGTDSCRAKFEDVDGGVIEALFRLDRSPIGILASPSPDVFVDCDGTAAEVRQLVAAVVRFCLVAQSEYVAE